MIQLPTKTAGFTIIELMVAISIGAVLLAIGVPSFSQTINKNRVTTTSNDLLGDILLTRSEAIKRNARVVLLRGSNWKTRTMFVDLNGDSVQDAAEQVILDRRAEGNEASIAANGGVVSSISYSPNGRAATVLSADSDFFQVSRSSAEKRRIRFSATGRPIIKVEGNDGY